MPQDYYSIITNTGLIKEAQAGQIGGSPINLTQIAVGDSGGEHYEPDSTAVALVNELHRATLTSSVLDANNPNQLIIEGVIDEEVGPFYIREVGIFDSDGDLFAIGKYPETFKSNFASGSGKRLYIRMIIGFVSTPNVEIMISENINFDPNFEANLNNELSDRLKISQNLADLNDLAQARNNLGLQESSITDFTAVVLPFAFNSPPVGWLECDGAEISRITYSSLFTKIRTTYGNGDGSNTFNIPDLRGEFIRGWDNGRGLDSGRNIGSFQDDAGRNITGNIGAPRVDGSSITPNGAFAHVSSAGNFSGGGGQMRNVNFDASRIWTSNHTANEFRPKNKALMYCIKY